MRKSLQLIGLALFLCSGFTAQAVEQLARREWDVAGVKREALVYVPDVAKTKPTPVVFAFHGHGGNMQNAARMFPIHTLWPEAISVYMQGLNTPGALTDPEGKKPGWQNREGEQGNRDLQFFDAVFASLKKDFKVDTNRVYSTGHSNGGGFTYLLWAERADEFGAFAPSASIGVSLVQRDEKLRNELLALRPDAKKALEKSKNGKPFTPKPVLHLAGEQDPLVKFQWQKMMMTALRRMNNSDEGKPWETDKRCTIYESKNGAPVVTYVHPGTHKFPDDGAAIIVKFFQNLPPRKSPKP